MQNPKTKTYFPNLNGLWFIATLLVIINHIEDAKKHIGYPNYKYLSFFLLQVICR